jgi:flagellar biosynthetic protein FlhB
MAGAGERTEQASARQRAERRAKGSGVGRSRELSLAFAVGAGFLTLSATAGSMAASIEGLIRSAISQSARVESIGADDLPALLGQGMGAVVGLVAPIAAVAAIAAIAANLGAGGFVLSAKALVPDFGRLNPVSGAARLLNRDAATRLLIAIAKLAVLGGVGAAIVISRAPALLGLSGEDPARIASVAGEALMAIGINLLVSLGVIGAIDYTLAQRKARGELRVTKDEARREVREQDGDPFVKAARRARARTMAFSRMMEAVKTADVVVTNPTHLAVALRYDPAKMRAPKIVAKGRDLLALRIKEIAREAGVTCVEDRPIARALISRPLGASVPPALYAAVAATIAAVARLNAARRR